jgi:hypothetical protein
MSDPSTLSTPPAVIQIGSAVQVSAEIFARRQLGNFYQIRPGQRFEVVSMGQGFAIIKPDGVGLLLMVQLADLVLW